MLKQVFHTALNNLTEVDVVIIAIGIITLLLIFFLYGVKRSIGTKRKLDVKLLNSCLFFSGMYQWGIDVCPLLGTFGTVVSLINSAMNPAELQSSFLYALTSTFWGLVAAVVCRFVDSLFRIDGYFEAMKVEN